MVTWNETVAQFLLVKDRLGKPIDTNIFETVVALNVLGVHTTQSCEGHLDWGLPYPWIDIQADMQQKFLLHQYLVKFYEQRTLQFESALVFHGYRLRSQGAAFSDFFSETEKEQKLKAYQAEMSGFTSFLKSLITVGHSLGISAPGRL
jgi:hypothetical protein